MTAKAMEAGTAGTLGPVHDSAARRVCPNINTFTPYCLTLIKQQGYDMVNDRAGRVETKPQPKTNEGKQA